MITIKTNRKKRFTIFDCSGDYGFVTRYKDDILLKCLNSGFIRGNSWSCFEVRTIDSLEKIVSNVKHLDLNEFIAFFLREIDKQEYFKPTEFFIHKTTREVYVRTCIRYEEIPVFVNIKEMDCMDGAKLVAFSSDEFYKITKTEAMIMLGII